MSQGKIVQCIGAVVDVEFPRDHIPKVYDALVVQDDGSSVAEKGLTLEVQQQIGDGVVRNETVLERGVHALVEDLHDLVNGCRNGSGQYW